MPLKTKTPVNQSASPALNEERMFRVNPEVDRRLDVFMQANDKMTEAYSKLVKESPDRAIRVLMLGKMFKHEAQLRVTERQAPQAKEWLDQQEPTIKQKIMDKLQKINPFYREKVLVQEIAREKTRIDFTPRPSTGQGMSL